MSQKRTRILVTPSPEAVQIIEELHGLLKQSRASIVAELLDMGLPALQETVRALRIAAEQPREAQRLMANFGAEATRDLMQAQLDLDVAIDRRTVKGKRAKKGATSGRAS